MKRFLLSAVLLVVLQGLAGCAFMGPDDREFFGRGWVSPKELDEPGPTRPNPASDKHVAPSTAGEQLPVTPNAWDVPEGMPQ